MRQLTLCFVAGLALHAQPDLPTQVPALIAKCAPRYTEQAKTARVEGTVGLYIEVTPDGRAQNIRVQRSLGSGLDETAIEVVKQWRFIPGRNDGKPIVSPITVEITFRPDDRSEPCRAGPAPVEPKP